MKILILAAMDKERVLLESILDYKECILLNGIDVSKGRIAGHDVFVAKCGIGKVNSALTTLRCIQSVSPDLVINSGVAGGAGLPIGTVLVPDKVAYHDVWCGPGTEYGEADGFRVFLEPDAEIIKKASALSNEDVKVGGLLCSGDKFISTAEEIAFIRSKFPSVYAVDMESASIAQTCISERTPFAIIRVVSDTPGEGENISQYQDFWTKAPQKTFDVVKQIIQSL